MVFYHIYSGLHALVNTFQTNTLTCVLRTDNTQTQHFQSGIFFLPFFKVYTSLGIIFSPGLVAKHTTKMDCIGTKNMPLQKAPRCGRQHHKHNSPFWHMCRSRGCSHRFLSDKMVASQNVSGIQHQSLRKIIYRNTLLQFKFLNSLDLPPNLLKPPPRSPPLRR